MKKFSAAILSLGLLSSMIAIASEGDHEGAAMQRGNGVAMNFATDGFRSPRTTAKKQRGRRRRTTARPRKPRTANGAAQAKPETVEAFAQTESFQQRTE